MPHTQIDWSSLGSVLYNYWTIFVAITAITGWLLRQPITRQLRRFIGALRSAHQQSRKIQTLENALANSDQKAVDWQTRFHEMEERYEALKAEFTRFGEDMAEIRKRMTTAEDLVRMLSADRDALIDFSRLLVGQLYTAGHMPDYPTPALQSILSVPGPPLPPDKPKP